MGERQMEEEAESKKESVINDGVCEGPVVFSSPHKGAV